MSLSCFYNKVLDSLVPPVSLLLHFLDGLVGFSIVQPAMRPQQWGTPFLPLKIQLLENKSNMEHSV